MVPSSRTDQVLPTGLLTFLFTDIEGSTRLWQQHPERMSRAIACHDALLRAAVEACDGHVVKTMGDGMHAVFGRALDALRAAAAIQRSLSDSAATADIKLSVRCGMHTGTAETRGADYFGDDVNRAARLMAAAHGGQVVVTESVHTAVSEELPPDLALERIDAVRLRDFPDPSPIFQLVAPGLKARFAALRPPAPVPHNLPAQITSFIGREAQIAKLSATLFSERLVTIVGPGGIGKTRATLEVAGRVRNRFDDGVWLVELGALGDPSLVPNAIAKVLEVPEEPGQPLFETLQQYLATRRLLLILDNCEHLATGCADFAEAALAKAPQIRILATSRAALGIVGESQYILAPLPVPAPSTVFPEMGNYDSVRLFRDRAALRKPGFALDDTNATPIGEICRRVDGIPLAIELAAARTRSMTPAEIAARLDQRFKLLSGGGPAMLPRQQTLRALVDWSYDLLGEQEKFVFARLSVFAGGWTIDAAEAVCADNASVDVVESLATLVQQSLTVVEPGGERYRLLETIREYAIERLIECGDAAVTRAKHVAWFLALAEQGSSQLVAGPEQAIWLRRLELEHDNLRAALQHTTNGDGEAEQAVSLCGALYPFWAQRGYFREGFTWSKRATALPLPTETPALAKALLGAGSLAFRLGDVDATQRSFERALSVSKRVGDRGIQARLLNNLGTIETDRGNLERAREHYEQSAALARELGNRVLEAQVAANLGRQAIMLGDIAEGRTILNRALELCEELDNRQLTVHVLGFLESAASDEGDHDGALALNERALLLARDLDDPLATAQLISSRAELLYNKQEFEAARSLYADALFRNLTLSVPQNCLHSLDSVASLVVTVGDHTFAVKMIGAVNALWRSIAGERGAKEAIRSKSDLDTCRVAIEKSTFMAAWEEGNTWSLDDAVNSTIAWLRK